MKPLVIKFENDDGQEIDLPAKYEVCGRCEGQGTHVNPSIDGHGITADEWNGPDWDDESKEAYLNGDYDVQCEECHGLRVVPIVDEDAVKSGSEELRQGYSEYLEMQRSEAEFSAIERAERRMGA